MKLLILISFLLVGCATNAPVGAFSSGVPIEQKNSCNSICEGLDMELGAMVVISNSAGCVCEVKRKNSSKRASVSAIAGGAATALAEQQRASQNNQQANQ